ncbi:glucokinase [Undibacterium pigrum]|uniref:Glucokinase n=1 Tax=Undibacterium pigrum TaxID=401470 RepID=A0A318JBR8_9BURK|nr:glucokinase [Undibacterium pigrum]PXX47028.1 glucokinase [Undibacterium pigrum]
MTGLSYSQLLVADIGGTHARFAITVLNVHGEVELRDYHRFACTDFASLAEIICTYREITRQSFSHASIAIAGVIEADHVRNSNLPWPVSYKQTMQDSGLAQLRFLNDFAALAWSVPLIKPADAIILNQGHAERPAGPVLVVGPGTGLGAAVWLPGPPSSILATEAGHAALAAGNPREALLLAQCWKSTPHVDNEMFLSGPGLLRLYRTIALIQGKAAILQQAAEVTTAAIAGQDAIAKEAVEIFCAMLGSLLGDMAIYYGAQAVYLTGGVPMQITELLQKSEFRNRFLNKGVMRAVVENCAVYLIEPGQLALLGAAHWYMQGVS